MAGPLNAAAIDWTSDDSHVFLNPALPQQSQNSYLQEIDKSIRLPGHIWLSSSGTTSREGIKLIALSKSAILVAADGANKHLQVTAKDIWLNVLPTFHVGGLSIFARANLSGSSVTDLSNQRWQPQNFMNALTDRKATLSSLVPAQLFDLVQANMSAPPTVRAIVIGGGALSSELYFQARDLFWPILPSFGMTECASQVATAELHSLQQKIFPALKILPHVTARSVDQLLEVKSKALLTGILQLTPTANTYYDPKTADGWLRTQDRVEMDDKQYLLPLGRMDRSVKILGELVNVDQLEQKFQQCCRNASYFQEVVFIAAPDSRSEHCLVAVTIGSLEGLESIAKIWNAQVLPFERVTALYFIDQVPRTPLHKVKYHELLQLLGFADAAATVAESKSL